MIMIIFTDLCSKHSTVRLLTLVMIMLDHAVVFRIHSVSLRLRLIPSLIDFAAMAFPLMGNRN